MFVFISKGILRDPSYTYLFEYGNATNSFGTRYGVLYQNYVTRQSEVLKHKKTKYSPNSKYLPKTRQ